MDDQERNREALIEHIAEQDRIIRRRNEQIAEAKARADELARELAAAATRADKAEKERDDKGAAYDQLKVLFGSAERAAIGWSARAQDAEARADQPRPLTADAITDEMVQRAADAMMYEGAAYAYMDRMREALAAALTPEPQRPEGAEEIEAIIAPWSMAHDGLDSMQLRALADHLAAMGYRKTGAES